MRTDLPTAVQVRRLYTEISQIMATLYSAKEIADIFYEVGIISQPESPSWSSYFERRRDYVLDGLHTAPDTDDFLSIVVPRVVFEAANTGMNVSSVVSAMKALGYVASNGVNQNGVAKYKPPSSFPSLAGEPTADNAPSKRPEVPRLQLPGLPPSIQELVDELNGCLDQGLLNAAALLTRKIIHQAVFVAMQQRGRGAELMKDGTDLDLSVALERCKQEYGITRQTMARITSAKWIGDSANHSYRVKVHQGDLDQNVTGLRLFLGEIFSGPG